MLYEQPSNLIHVKFDTSSTQSCPLSTMTFFFFSVGFIKHYFFDP